jgi:hypothetical protein
MEQVRRRVVPREGQAALRVDAGPDHLAASDRPALDEAVVHDDTGAGALRVLDPDLAPRPDEAARVTDLPAALGVERRPVEDDPHPLPRDGRLHRRLVHDQGQDLAAVEQGKSKPLLARPCQRDATGAAQCP